MADVTIWWKDSDQPPAHKVDVEIEESMTALTIYDSETTYSKIPLAGVLYYDVEL